MKSYAPLMSIVALATVALPVGASAADSLPLPKSVVTDLVMLRCRARGAIELARPDQEEQENE